MQVMEIMSFKECTANPNATETEPEAGTRKLSSVEGAKTFMLPAEQITARSTLIHSSEPSAVRRSLLQVCK